MRAEALRDCVLAALEDLRAVDVTVLDVGDRSVMTDWYVIATATSARHARALAGKLCTELKASGDQPLGVEGRDEAEWVLVDCGAVVAHIMQAHARAFYDLERLWTDPAAVSLQSG